MLFVQDEARFGRIDKATACWTQPNSRAIVGSQIVRQYTYLYGAFCPETGEHFCLILPYANSDCMNIFMKELSAAFPQYNIVLAMDNAAWHPKYKKIDNITPLFQPPYSPEVNPSENIWKYVRDNGGFRNTTFNSMDEVEAQIIFAVNTLLTKDTVKSITGFNWITKCF
jgi:putative transposase